MDLLNLDLLIVSEEKETIKAIKNKPSVNEKRRRLKINLNSKEFINFWKIKADRFFMSSPTSSWLIAYNSKENRCYSLSVCPRGEGTATFWGNFEHFATLKKKFNISYKEILLIIN